jgi:hypothetical protein
VRINAAAAAGTPLLLQAKPAPVKVGGPNASKVPQLLAQQLSGRANTTLLLLLLSSTQAKPAPVKVGGPNASKVPQLLAQQLSGQRQYPLDAAAPGEWGLQPEQGLPGAQPVHNGGILRLEYAGEGGSEDSTAQHTIWTLMYMLVWDA